MFEKILEALAEKLKTAELYEGVILALEGAKLIDNSEGLYLKKDSGDWIPRAKVDEERAPDSPCSALYPSGLLKRGD